MTALSGSQYKPPALPEVIDLQGNLEPVNAYILTKKTDAWY